MSTMKHKFVPGVGSVPTGPKLLSHRSPLSIQNVTCARKGPQRYQQPTKPCPKFSPSSRPESHHDFKAMIAREHPHTEELDHSDRRAQNKRDYERGRRQRRSRDAYTPDRERSRSPLRQRESSSENLMFFPEDVMEDAWQYVDSLTLETESAAFETTTEVVEEAECICPISDTCPRRKDNELDCRSLVAQWKGWDENFDTDINIGMSSWQPDPNAPVATMAEMKAIIDPFEEISNLSATMVRSLQRVFDKWKLAILTMKSRNVDQELLDQTQAIASLQNELSRLTLVEIRQKRLRSWYLEEVAILLRNWKRGDYYCDPNRGLKRVMKNGNGFQTAQWLLDKDYVHYTPPQDFGKGNLINGEVWTSRLQMLRDGAHGAIQAGISGTVEDGARSIVMGKHDPSLKDCYADKDFGKVIEYVGTALKGSEEESGTTNIKDKGMYTRRFNPSREPTDCTKMLMRSLETGIQVRVFRSCHLPAVVKNRPHDKLYRFDGMYVVTRKTPLKESLQIWSFRLERCPRQGKLRGFSHDPQRKDSGARDGWRRY